MHVERHTSKGQLVPIVYVQDALAASQSDVQLTVQDSAVAVDGISMPYRGHVVGMSYDLSAAASAGTLTIGATKGGTENATTTQTVTTGTKKAVSFARGVMKFDAGDQLGVEITTDSSWNGTTADLVVTLWVLLEMNLS